MLIKSLKKKKGIVGILGCHSELSENGEPCTRHAPPAPITLTPDSRLMGMLGTASTWSSCAVAERQVLGGADLGGGLWFTPDAVAGTDLPAGTHYPWGSP